jgi:hypothetical protein
MSKEQYQKLNNITMGIIYAPALVVTAFLETRAARQVIWNRRHNQEDEDKVEEWEQVEVDMKEWDEKVKQSKPDVSTDETLVHVRALRKEIEELKQSFKQ